MMFTLRSYGNFARAFLFAILFVASVATARDYSSDGIADVVTAANLFLQRGDYASAIPALEEVVRRAEKSTDPKMLDILQRCRFQLARSLYKTGDTPAGMTVLDDYLDQEPRKQERMALRMVAQGFSESQDWEKIEKIAGRLLDFPDLSKEDRLNANLLLGQSRFRQEKWKECIEPLAYIATKTEDKQTRQLIQVMIVRALVEAENWNQLFAWIPRVFRTDAKYDITLNLTLMGAGKARFKQNDLLNALYLYRMVLPREKLIGFSEDRVAMLSKKLNADAKVGIDKHEKKNRREEIDGIRASIKELSALPPYEDEVTFRIGQIYYQLKRYWEGYVLFDRLYNQDRTSDIGEAAILQSVMVLYDLKELARAEERILQYAEEQPNGQYVRTLLSKMMRDNLGMQDTGKVVGLRKNMDRFSPSSDTSEKLIEADLHYMMAFGYFQEREYKLAGEQFSVILDSYPDSPIQSDSSYYRGMTSMFQGAYQDAIDDFLFYQEKYVGGAFFPASIFRQGICLLALKKTGLAEAVFTRFIDAYPDDMLVSEAYSMRGDIEAAKDGKDNPETEDVDEYDPNTLDRALVDYRKAIDKSKTPRQAAYAAFQAAKVYKLEAKWQDIIGLMNYYLALREGEADVAQAVFWVGQSQIELEQVDEAISAYIEAILTFGGDVAQEGVDKIIRELITIADRHLSDEDRVGLGIQIKLKLTETKSSDEALNLRLRMVLALLDGDEKAMALGVELLDAKQDLKVASPVSLSVMCDAAVAAGDVAQMGRLFDYFTSNFEESDDLWHAYRAKTFQLLAEGDLELVLQSVEEAQGIFGANEFMGWSQIINADTLLKMKKNKQAEEAYNIVLRVAEWRGPLYAEAMFGMGRCRLAIEDFKTAHAYFQRTYLLFMAYDGGKWAADGYLAAADCLLRLGRETDAVKTWQDMLENEYVNTLPQAETAKELIKKYGGE